MPDRQASPYKHFQRIVADPDLRGGNPALRGTRFSVAHVLECLSAVHYRFQSSSRV